jgi:hypothetical protein
VPHGSLAALTALLIAAAPAGAVQADPAASLSPSDNVTLVNTMPEATAAISMAFSSDSPHLYVSTLKGLHTYDISDPEFPQRLGYLPFVGYQNEAMALGERPETGEKFVTFASTLALVTLDGDVDTTARFFIVIEVTDPADPTIVGRLQTATRTHTVTCDSPRCDYLYSDGRPQGQISIVDMTDFREPEMVRTYRSVVPQGHDADVDESGILWHVGGQGSVALDISDPENPVHLQSTTIDAVSPRPWNKFIHHNSIRPNAAEFATEEEPDDPDWPSGEPSVFAGNVLLVTEEQVGSGRCDEGSEGAFQTWYIPWLDADRYAEVNPGLASGRGEMHPLAKWNTELLDSGEPAEHGTRCSAHYFDYHQDGFVAQGWYGQGMRVLDVRDATDIKQVGYFLGPSTQVWGAYWVPEYDDDGVQTGERTDLVYTADHERGVDILRVDLPDTEPEDTTDLRAPILPQWVTGAADPLSTWAPDPDYGWACPLPTASTIRTQEL